MLSATLFRHLLPSKRSTLRPRNHCRTAACVLRLRSHLIMPVKLRFVDNENFVVFLDAIKVNAALRTDEESRRSKTTVKATSQETSC